MSDVIQAGSSSFLCPLIETRSVDAAWELRWCLKTYITHEHVSNSRLASDAYQRHSVSIQPPKLAAAAATIARTSTDMHCLSAMAHEISSVWNPIWIHPQAKSWHTIPHDGCTSEWFLHNKLKSWKECCKTGQRVIGHAENSDAALKTQNGCSTVL